MLHKSARDFQDQRSSALRGGCESGFNRCGHIPLLHYSRWLLIGRARLSTDSPIVSTSVTYSSKSTSALTGTSTQSSPSTSSSSDAQTAGSATANTSASRHISTVLAVALSTTLTLLAVAIIALFLKWRRRYLKRVPGTRAPNVLFRGVRSPSSRSRQALGERDARPFFTLAEDQEMSSMHHSSFMSDRPWTTSEQHSVCAHHGSVHAPSDILPAVVKKRAQRVYAIGHVLPSLPTNVYASRTGLSDTLSQTPASLSSHQIAPPHPRPASQRQRQVSSAILPSPILTTPATPDTLQTSSDAHANERLVLLPWSLGERLLALLATAQVPEERVAVSEGSWAEGLPAYASDE